MSDIDWGEVFRPAQRANPDDVEIYLWHAKKEGWIKDWKRHKIDRRLVWTITVQKTRYQNYHDPGDQQPYPEIALDGRGVLAFIEGLWVGRGHEPTHRAGHSYGPSNQTVNRRIDQQRRAQRRAEANQEAYEDTPDISQQRELSE